MLFAQTSGSAFEQIVAYATGADSGLLLEDLDGDADADVVLASPTARFAAGSATGVRGQDELDQTATPLDNLDGGDVAVGDFNGDGIADLAVAAFGSSPINQILLGNGDGTFNTGPSTFGAGDSRSVKAADFDCDGDLDLVVANSENEFGPAGTPQNNELWINDGNANFTMQASFDPSPSMALAVGDITGDGIPDIIVANRGDATVGAARRNRFYRTVLTAGVISLVEEPTAFGPITNPDNLEDSRDVALGDVDGDGDLDLVVANNGTQDQLWRQANGLLTLVRQFGASEATFSIELADLDEDGDLDLIAGIQASGGAMSRVHPGTFGIDFQLPINLPNQGVNMSPSDLEVADVNGDGFLDIVVGNGNFTQTDRVYFGQGSTTFVDSRDLDTSSTAGIEVLDADWDGDLDIVTAERNGIGARLYLQR